jgi:peroxiredoxin
MLHLVLFAALASLTAATEAPLTAGTQLNYRGSVEARTEEPGKAQKSFELTLWILDQNESGADVFWLVDERGRGEFPWFERFGRLRVDPRWHTAAEGPAVLYDRGEGRSPVSVPLPFLKNDKPLAAGETFRDGTLDLVVDRATKVDERPAWRVSARDAFGPKRTLWVAQDAPTVLKLSENLTLGRGEPFELKLELLLTERLDAEASAALAKGAERLMGLRGKLNLPPRTQAVDWKDERLAMLKEQLPALGQELANTPLAKVTLAAQRDLAVQSGRNDAVAHLGAKFEGRDVEDFSLKGSAGEALSLADLTGHVTVLHFWDYRDEPLKEPYGQVGYLDFMYQRRKDTGLRVYGVAVDGRLADEKSRGAAERSVRKLKSFMNLSYPVLFDPGAVLKQFGDPRLVGASLPLFVVISPDAKILHYHVGHYDVHQDQGLKELDEIIGKAMQAK